VVVGEDSFLNRAFGFRARHVIRFQWVAKRRRNIQVAIFSLVNLKALKVLIILR